ncbi:DUF5060 domain-containing protein [Paenibacillus harenae]|uniref:DUF5060 domain-containing protein n=1 Tax=Paenibacillus harenae TaxID=306543 RepID=UPI00042374C4|nr:DUF5060 domain-containing protein [Paenibacillus harenae]
MFKTKRLIVIGASILLIILVVIAAWQIADSGNPVQSSLIDLPDPDGDEGPELTSVQTRAGDDESETDQATAESISLPAYDKLELALDLKADYANPYDPEQIDVRAVFLAPSGKEWRINGFYNGAAWRLRFTPNESGEWRYKVAVTDKTGTTVSEEALFIAEKSGNKGWIRVSDHNKRFFEYDDGSSFYGVGVAYPWGITEDNLTKIADNGGNLVTYWNGNYDNAGMGGGKEQLESILSGIGSYDMLKGFRMDELVDWFEARNLLMNFVIWPHDSLADKIENWPATWTRGAYSTLGAAEDFYSNAEMWKYQEKLYRYIIARWGYSPSIGIWNLITEINGTDGWAFGREDEANAWVAKVHHYFKENDPYGHPTMGSMAGGGEDFWDHGYKTLDIADRENYYDLNFGAYAEDIQNRWKQYEKPVMTGETGNVTDAVIHHNSMWSSLANGAASGPIWWALESYNDEMYKQMNVFASFVRKIDFAELRQPVAMQTPKVDKQLEQEVLLEDGADAADWVMPDWPEANKDSTGALFKPEGLDGSIQTSMLFATGSFSQGFLQQVGGRSDWQGYDELLVDIYTEYDGAEPLKARPVLMPVGNWTEGDSASDNILRSGEWTTLRVPLKDVPAGYWREGKQITAGQLDKIAGWGVKVYANSTDKAAEAAVIKVRNPRLSAAEPPTVEMNDSEGWAMVGEKTSYGWLVSENGAIGGKTADIAGFGETEAGVTWFDTWTGEEAGAAIVKPVNGVLKLTAPAGERADMAFIITR